MKKKSIYFLISLSVITLILILILINPYFNIKTINITGLDNISKQEIISTLNLDKETNLIAFNTISAKNKLSKNNYIDSIQIKKILPSTLEISIVEKEIYGYIPYINNFLYISKDGEVIDIKNNYTKPLPLIIGLEFDYFALGEKLQTDNQEKLKLIVEFTSICYEKSILENIVKIDISNIYDIRLNIENIIVILGDKSNLSTKINTLEEILKNLDTSQKGFLYLDDTYKNPTFKYIT